jgi:predicted DsbA family dithiol-disulfide isomerase
VGGAGANMSQPPVAGQGAGGGALVARPAATGDIIRLSGRWRVGKKSLLVFADYACPYCYLAESAVARLRREGVAVGVAAFELRPAGTPLLTPGEPWMKEAWARSVQPLAQEFSVPIAEPSLSTRTRKAHEAVAYARSEGALEAMHAAVYRAWWVEGRDIGRIDVLADIAGEVGLDPTAMRVALDIDQWAERVEQDLQLADRLRLSGVPAYLLTEEGDGDDGPARAELRAGVQRYEDLKAWIHG